MSPRWVLILLCELCTGYLSTVTLSNTELPMDTNGDTLFTGETTMIYFNNTYYIYLNDWGNCSDVNCCIESNQCSSCCFKGKPGDCVYANGHNVRVYSTINFKEWNNLGIALSSNNYIPGIVFRPQIVYNKLTEQFIMWYEDRWLSGTNPGYAISISSTPYGPFMRYNDSVRMSTSYKIGDYDIFIDDDGSAYHVRTGVVIEKLNDEYTGTTDITSVVIKDSSVEGPSMFKRNNIYYVLVGKGCCSCKGGTNIIVYSSTNPLGPYKFISDVGSNHTNNHEFNATSPYNYVTHAQGSKVIDIGNDQYLWIGNQWVTSNTNGNPRNKDLLYWTVLQFDKNGEIQQVIRQDTTNINI